MGCHQGPSKLTVWWWKAEASLQALVRMLRATHGISDSHLTVGLVPFPAIMTESTSYLHLPLAMNPTALSYCSLLSS